MNQSGHSHLAHSPNPSQFNISSTIFPADAVTSFPAVENQLRHARASSNQSPTFLSETAAIQRRKLAGGESHHHHYCPSPGIQSAGGQQNRPQSEPNLNRTQQQQQRSTKNNQNIIVVPPIVGHNKGKEVTATKRHPSQPVESNRVEEGMLVQLQQKLFEHYHTAAYSLIIVSYFLAFCEYLYLRLISLIFPDPITYRRQCEKHFNEIVYRNELHFASGVAIFLVMSAYQLVCFFLLTISSKYLEVKRTFSHVLSIEERLQHELVFAVKRTMFATLYPTFAIYILSSFVIFCSIFYMVGLRDPILHVGSQVIVYLFDLFIILYFLAFPILCVLFHPDINCRSKFANFCCTTQQQQRRRKGQNGSTNSQSFSQRNAKEGNNNDNNSNEGIEDGGPGIVNSPSRHQQIPTRIFPETVNVLTNYGSLERREGRGGCPMQMSIEEEGAEGRVDDGRETNRVNVEEEEDSIRRRMKKRRQSRYKRLRGSDESAECQNGGIERIKEKQIREGRGEGENVNQNCEMQIRGLELAEVEEEEDGFGPDKC